MAGTCKVPPPMYDTAKSHTTNTDLICHGWSGAKHDGADADDAEAESTLVVAMAMASMRSQHEGDNEEWAEEADPTRMRKMMLARRHTC